jgi:hypothetical protein
MFTCTLGPWHIWQYDGDKVVSLSDEHKKHLRAFPHADACISWLYLNGYKLAARGLNKAYKEWKNAQSLQDHKARRDQPVCSA